jgi:peptidyl-prolyl cis-trans isomerase SurA
VLNGRVQLVRALPVLSVVLLSGCGIAGTQFHPGVAAEVGDQTITSRHVDKVTDDYCTGFEKISKSDPQSAGDPVPLRYVTNQFVTLLVERDGAEQLADSYGVSPGSESKSAMASFEPQLESLNDDQKDAFEEILGARAYTNDVLTQIGEISLEDQGTKDATEEDQLAEGQKLLKAWLADHDVEVNPRYAVDLDTTGQVDTDLSVAVGSKAKDGLKAEPDPAYTGSLPGHLVCLD